MSSLRHSRSLAEPGDYEPILQGFKGSRLMLPRCDACGAWVFPPTHMCRSCSAGHVSWHEVSDPSGTLFSYTVVWHTTLPEFKEQVPYAVAIVEVDDTGVRLAGRVQGSCGSELRIGQLMRPHFGYTADEVAALYWEPVT